MTSFLLINPESKKPDGWKIASYSKAPAIVNEKDLQPSRSCLTCPLFTLLQGLLRQKTFDCHYVQIRLSGVRFKIANHWIHSKTTDGIQQKVSKQIREISNNVSEQGQLYSLQLFAFLHTWSRKRRRNSKLSIRRPVCQASGNRNFSLTCDCFACVVCLLLLLSLSHRLCRSLNVSSFFTLFTV